MTDREQPRWRGPEDRSPFERFESNWKFVNAAHKPPLSHNPAVQHYNTRGLLVRSVELARSVLQDPLDLNNKPSIEAAVEFINAYDPVLAGRISDKIEKAVRDLKVLESRKQS